MGNYVTIWTVSLFFSLTHRKRLGSACIIGPIILLLLCCSGAVPKLDISIDQDHMKWLQEQSARHENKDYSALEHELKQPRLAQQPPVRGKQLAQAVDHKKVYTRKKIQKE